MKKAGTSLFIVVALGLFTLCTVGLADEFADKSVPLFCAVGWLGEFTHIEPSIGEVPPTRNDLPSTLQALAYSPDGILYAATGNRNGLYKIDPWTGNAEYFLSTNVDIAGMAFSPSGELYVTGSSGARYLRTIDLNDGSSTSVGTLWGDRNSAQGLAFSPHGILYAIKPNVWPGTYELLTIDLDDAQMHLLGSYSSTANVNQSITFTTDGRLYAIGRDAFAELNPTDGSLIGSHVTPSGDYRGLAIVPPMVYYVDDDALGANNGSSWADAYNYLQDALAAAYSGDEIRVAQGIYRPDQGAVVATGDRAATFELINGVAIKGGYAGAGTPDPDARRINLYETILSGDLNCDDIGVNEPCDLLDDPTRAENSCHIVTGGGTDETAVLDGFTITGGSATDPVNKIGENYWGAGMNNRYGSPTVTNCAFIANLARNGGGGMNNFKSSPVVTNCTFSQNAARGGGSGMENYDNSNPIIINCAFSANYSINHGAAMHNGSGSNPTLVNCLFNENVGRLGGAMYNSSYLVASDPTLINCTFSSNMAVLSGGGVHNRGGSSPTLVNCILWGNSDNTGMGESAQIFSHSGDPVINYTCVQGWTGTLGGTGNIGHDPLFADTANADYHLQPGSPCINTGDPDYVAGPNETDLDGRPRVIFGRIDMGAYETPILADVRILPQTINLASRGNWITCYIWLPEEYDVADIEQSSIFLEHEIQPVQFSFDEQKQVETARFSREDVQPILEVGDIELKITGRLIDGTLFEGMDTIKVIDKADKK